MIDICEFKVSNWITLGVDLSHAVRDELACLIRRGSCLEAAVEEQRVELQSKSWRIPSIRDVTFRVATKHPFQGESYLTAL